MRNLKLKRLKRLRYLIKNEMNNPTQYSFISLNGNIATILKYA